MLNRHFYSILCFFLIAVGSVSTDAATIAETTPSLQSTSLQQLEAKARLLETLETLQYIVHSQPSFAQWETVLNDSRKANEYATKAGLQTNQFSTIINLLEQAIKIQTIDVPSYSSECRKPVPPDRCIEAFIRDLLTHTPEYRLQPFHELVIEAKHAMRQHNDGLEAYRDRMAHSYIIRLDTVIGLALDELTGTPPLH